jgi:hypothetical protein
MRQLEVARELRARIKAALDEAGVQPAGPDTILISAPPAPAITSAEPSPVPVPAEVELAAEEDEVKVTAGELVTEEEEAGDAEPAAPGTP